MTELQREKQRLTEKLQSIGSNYDVSRSAASSIAELKAENAKLKVSASNVVTLTFIIVQQ